MVFGQALKNYLKYNMTLLIMMRQLIFATHNDNKVKELNAIVPSAMQIISLKDIGWMEEIEEPFFTLEENGKEKARTIHKALGKECFAEDSGLFVDALQGAPGVFSARYATKNNSDKDNIGLVLEHMKNVANRSAYFQTVICFVENNHYHFFTGICKGEIMLEKSGNSGFGYDPIFIPTGAEKTFAEMTMEEKNQFSHRKKATDLFIKFLEEKYA
jgi:XTP/dITP diphosphohydrolase